MSYKHTEPKRVLCTCQYNNYVGVTGEAPLGANLGPGWETGKYQVLLQPAEGLAGLLRLINTELLKQQMLCKCMN